MKVQDIRPIKMELRQKAKMQRQSMSPTERAARCASIQNQLFAQDFYKIAKTLLIYVSMNIEVDTSGIIKDAWSKGKKVVVPRCVAGTRNMEFYQIYRYSDLESGAFGVLEPIPEKCEKVTDFTTGLCVVPALLYDREGYRLGFGKGYYDRFLASFGGETVGLAYDFAITSELLPHGKYDQATDYIVTEQNTLRIKEGRREL